MREQGSAIIVHSALMHGRAQKSGGGGKPRYFIDSSYCQVHDLDQEFGHFLGRLLKTNCFGSLSVHAFSRTMTTQSGSGRVATTATRLAQSLGLERGSMIIFGTRRRRTPPGSTREI